MIIYKDGTREVFKKSETTIEDEPREPVKKENTQKQIIVTEPKEDKKIIAEPKEDNYFSIAPGYGNSYGGIGIRLQGRINMDAGVGWDIGVGFHGGAGYFPDAPILLSVGVKFFPYKDIYINAQFGSFGVETYTVETEYSYWDGNSWVYEYDYFYEKWILYGPSLLVGGDWIFGERKQFGFNAGGGLSINLNTSSFQTVWPAIDLGFIVKF